MWQAGVVGREVWGGGARRMKGGMEEGGEGEKGEGGGGWGGGCWSRAYLQVSGSTGEKQPIGTSNKQPQG